MRIKSRAMIHACGAFSARTRATSVYVATSHTAAQKYLVLNLLFLLWYLSWGVIGTTLRVGMLRRADKCFDHGRYVFAKADGYGLGPRQHRGLPRPTRPHGASQKMHSTHCTSNDRAVAKQLHCTTPPASKKYDAIHLCYAPMLTSDIYVQDSSGNSDSFYKARSNDAGFRASVFANPMVSSGHTGNVLETEGHTHA